MSVDVQLDLTAVQKFITAHQTALMSFCRDWREAYPDKIPQAEQFLLDLEAEYQLPEGSFLKVTRVLRGEADEA
ncbi:hypothetical protein I7F13_23815 [Sinorhizobium meliloti]|uniref:hypothetical protein n=1 Tax=Rhizobium meliloti TaxID=382 RepID=UPI000FDBDDB5|nr:hypothetical protein [Sinorhizobium meliloti]MDE3825195.1 hypothetical protein [Sinorhizobium meliloti]RVM42694.1 hypothetical protein CN127_27540 [Sinorhizobium meliloti]RVN62040.1 hypothetical protein CN106_26185 [Sinorhizobium meliloti]